MLQTKMEALEDETPVWRTVDYYYDAAGRNYRTTLPYFTTSGLYSAPEAEVKSTYAEYDAIGRVMRSFNTEGNYIRSLYGKQYQLTIDEAGHASAGEVSGKLNPVKK